MSTTFATNTSSNSAVSYLQRNSEWQSSSIAKLSSGSRIVKASDDAASLAVGTKLKADVTALKQASTNASQASSMLQIADGALSRVGDALMRMKALATQARSDVLSPTERAYLDEEYQEMAKQIDFIAESTKFNGNALIDGTLGAIVQQDGELGIETVGDIWGDSSLTAGTPTVGTGQPLYIQRTGDLEVGEQFQFEYTADATNGNTDFNVTRLSTGETRTLSLDDADTGQYKTFEIEDWGVSVIADAFDASGGASDITADADSTLTYNGDTQGVQVNVLDADLSNGTEFQVTRAVGGTTLQVDRVDKDGTTISETVDMTGDETNERLTKSYTFEGLGIEVQFANYDATAGGGNDLAAADDMATVVAGEAKFQVGVTAGADDIGVSIADSTASSLDVAGTDIKTLVDAEDANGKLDTAIEAINTARANVGATMSRLEKIGENIATTTENLDASRSVLMDVDVAEEMTRFSTNQVMTQAATAMLAQANQLPQNLMRLLQ